MGKRNISLMMSCLIVFFIMVELLSAFLEAGEASDSPNIQSLLVEPGSVERDEFITISVEVTNVGGRSGSHTVTLNIDGETIEEKTVTLDSDETGSFSFKVPAAREGTFTVEVDGHTGSYTVTAPPRAAELQITNLTVTPTDIEPEEPVAVSVEVSNLGEESGSQIIEVKVDSVYIDSELVRLKGGESTTLTFTVTADIIGTHTVEIDGLNGSFTVLGQPPIPPEITRGPWIYALALLVIIITVIIFKSRM